MPRSSKSTVPAVTVGKSGYALGQKRSEAEWDALFTSTILPALKAGSTRTEQRALYGRSELIRMAARRAGYASIADAIRGDKTFTPIKVKGVQPKVVARRINEARQSGASWNTLRLASGLDRDEMVALLGKHGFEVTTGRVIVSERGKARAAKAAAEAATAAAKPKRVRKPRAPKVETVA